MFNSFKRTSPLQVCRLAWLLARMNIVLGALIEGGPSVHLAGQTQISVFISTFKSEIAIYLFLIRAFIIFIGSIK